MSIKVENLKFNDPVTTEYRRQKSEVAKRKCRHLKGVEQIRQIDWVLDEVESYIACSVCGKILSPYDIEQREQLLTKFKNI